MRLHPVLVVLGTTWLLVLLLMLGAHLIASL